MSAKADPLRVDFDEARDANARDVVRDEGEIGASPHEVRNASNLAATEGPRIRTAVKTMTKVTGRPNVVVDANGEEWVDTRSAAPARVAREASESEGAQELAEINPRAPYATDAEIEAIQRDQEARRLAEQNANRQKRKQRLAVFAVCAGLTVFVAAILF